MPAILVCGVPLDAELGELHLDLREAASSVKELELQPNEWSVHVANERLEASNLHIRAKVEGLFEKPQRTMESRNKLSDLLAEILLQWAIRHMPSCKSIVLLIEPYNTSENPVSFRYPT